MGLWRSIAGVLASALIAVILQVVFPAVTSGANREIIEGGVGIFAVAMMILIGIWLHSKSSVKQWNDFMDRQMKTVTATGSFVSMFALVSWLSSVKVPRLYFSTLVLFHVSRQLIS